MATSTSEFREEMLPGQPLEAPVVRYPFSARRYLFAALRPVPARSQKIGTPSFAMARSRRMQRSARALLWWVPFWYAIAQLALFVWMDESWQLTRIRVEKDKWKQLHVRLAEAPDRPLVLMLGSSRTDWAFQAAKLDGQPGPDGRPLLVYNFGVPTTGPLHEALWANDLFDEGLRPRLLLVELASTHLNASRRGIQSEEHFTVAQWLSAHQLFFFRRYYTNTRRAMTSWLEACVAPCYSYRWHIHEHLQGHHSRVFPFDQTRRPMDSCGCRILADDPGTPQYRAFRWSEASRMYWQSLQRFHVGKKPAQAMHDLLARCRREHVAVALVQMPIAQEFNDYFSKEGRAELASFVADLRQRYGVEVIDASDWLEKEDFDDGHHVLKVGAQKFTKRIIVEVQKLLVQTNPSEQARSTP